MMTSSQSINNFLSRDLAFFELEQTFVDLLQTTSSAVNVMNGKFPAIKQSWEGLVPETNFRNAREY